MSEATYSYLQSELCEYFQILRLLDRQVLVNFREDTNQNPGLHGKRPKFDGRLKSSLVS